jgi:hypothetical protein
MTRDRLARLATAGGLCAFAVPAVLAGVLAGAPAAVAVDDTRGTPGFCPDGVGVTVVVDFQQLGGQTIVRCAPGSQARTGLEVLQDSGFQVEGVQRWGSGFVCRIENRPSGSEPLPVDGADGYREACVDTPPAAAFWGYWQADDRGEWRYSESGVKNTTVGSGGFQGWSFSLNATEGPNPPPRIAPRSGAQPAQQQAEGASWTGGEASPDVRDKSSNGSAWSSMLGLGAVGVVAAVVAVGSVRRRRHRSEPHE